MEYYLLELQKARHSLSEDGRKIYKKIEVLQALCSEDEYSKYEAVRYEFAEFICKYGLREGDHHHGIFGFFKEIALRFRYSHKEVFKAYQQELTEWIERIEEATDNSFFRFVEGGNHLGTTTERPYEKAGYLMLKPKSDISSTSEHQKLGRTG